MKNFVLISIVIFLFSSCSKDNNHIINDDGKGNSIISSVDNYNVTNDPLGWLVFTDRDHMMSTINGLQQDFNNYEDQFDACIDNIPDGLSDEAEDAALANCGYIYEKPLSDFENLFTNFVSIRQKMRLEQDNWLSQQTPPINTVNMPDHYCNVPYMSSIYNEFGEVQVGGLVYFYREDGKSVAIKRSELNSEIVQQFRILFNDPTFDVNNYPLTPLNNDSLKDAFLFGQQMSAKSSIKFEPVSVTYVAVGVVTIMLIIDVVLWTQGTPSGCYYDHNILNSWSNNGYKIDCRLKWREFLVSGQNAYAKEDYYRGKRRRLGRLKIDASIQFFIKKNHQGTSCFNGSDGSADLYKEKRRRTIRCFENVGFYHRSAVHENTANNNFMYGRYYLNGDLKVTLY